MKEQFSLLLILIVTSLTTIAQTAKNTVNADSMLIKGCTYGDVQSIKKAISLNADFNCTNSEGQSPLYLVSKLARFDLVKLLVDNGANVNTCGNDKITPLHWAVEYNNVKIVKLLLEHGANVDARDGLNESPVHWAAWTGNIESAELLLKYGGDPNATNNGGTTPMDLAKRQEHWDLVKLFEQTAK